MSLTFTVTLCAIQNFIQETDHKEGAIPTNPFQAAHAPFPSDIDDEHGDGFIVEDDDEENSEVKLLRRNIANEMWKSYMDYMADTDSDDDFSGLSK